MDFFEKKIAFSKPILDFTNQVFQNYYNGSSAKSVGTL